MPIIKLQRDLIFFDLETTGLDVDNDRIVQIAVMKFKPYVAERAKSSLEGGWSRIPYDKHTFSITLNPKIKIPKKAYDVHGITNKQVAKKKTFEQIAPKLYKVFHNCDVAGYNIKHFDIPLLKNEFARCGIVWKPKAVLDAYQIFKQFLPHSLEGAMQVYCCEKLEGAHDAMMDVKATVKVLWSQLLRHREIYDSDTDTLHERFTDPEEVDAQGKLRRDPELGIVLNFSKKYKGKPIAAIPKSFWEWCKDNNVFTNETWELVNREIEWE